jgi:SAM-dependent methyltransferase
VVVVPETSSEPSQFYTGIVAEIYAPLRSSVPEVEPYARFIAGSGEPALELGCGTGDPLLDLRARGLDVEGLDSSADMLARCRAAADARGLSVVLHEQRMETMHLERRYRSIFLAGPTFNLLPDDATARCALERMRAHLDDGASALIPLFVPQPMPVEQLGRAREHVTSDGRRMAVATVSESRDIAERRQTSVLRYELRSVGTTEVEVVERPWVLHWHTVEGFRTLAATAGLATRSVRRPDGAFATQTDNAFVFHLVPAP